MKKSPGAIFHERREPEGRRDRPSGIKDDVSKKRHALPHPPLNQASSRTLLLKLAQEHNSGGEFPPIILFFGAAQISERTCIIENLKNGGSGFEAPLQINN